MTESLLPQNHIQALLNELSEKDLQHWLTALQTCQQRTAPTAVSTQCNLGKVKGLPVLVQGGTASIGDQYHLDVAALEGVLKRLLAERQPPQPQQTPNHLPPSSAVAFVGREKELAALHTQLHQANPLTITAIQGRGGIGKTELALQYAQYHRDQHTYPGGICWVLAKEQNVGTEIVNFVSDPLGLAVPTNMDLSRQAQWCWHHWPVAGDVLIVMDDVTGPDDRAAYQAIQPYLPPPGSRFRVLLTTQLQLGAALQSFPIEVLSEPASLNLLKSLIGEERVDQEREVARALCHWLDHLPLGLELVGRFLQDQPDLTLIDLQQQLQDTRPRAVAWNQEPADMTANYKSLAAALALTWRALTEAEKALAYGLCLFALAPIDWKFIEVWFANPHQGQNDFGRWRSLAKWLGINARPTPSETHQPNLDTLRDEGLVRRGLLKRVGQGSYQMHPLIRKFIRHQLAGTSHERSLKQRYCQEMVQIAQTIPETPTREQILELTPTIPHLAEAATTWQRWLADDSLYWPFIGLGRFYQGQGDYGQAEPWWQNCLTVTGDRLGKTHPDVASGLDHLAALYESQERYSQAEPLF